MKKTLLVVEDDKQYQSLLQSELEEAGYTVILAGNGAIALDKLKTEHVDLILLDLLMPEVDGTTFYYQLKTELKKKIPIIILTNVADTIAYDPAIIKAVLIKANSSLAQVVETVKKAL